MMLRNKKTGEVGKIVSYDASKGIFAVKSGGRTRYYYTLAKLNEEWEDYTPAEPLIKDEKNRKIVRAWAEANGDKKIKATRDMLQFWGKKSLLLEFDGEIGDGDIETYTIAELCGEKEE